tara:strand:+ start:520 stop:1404 length:885 start_codon:yes stop_codon:yes gene_type:complete
MGIDTIGTNAITDNSVSTTKMLNSVVVIEGEGIGSNDNDITLPTSAAVKDYVDTQVGSVAADITGVTAGTGLTGGGASGDVTLNVIGGTGITANADDITIDSTVVTLAGTQTLTNKTITNPKINAPVPVIVNSNDINKLSGLNATSAQLNYNDITSLGTSQASKVLTADANHHTYMAGEFKAKHYKEQYLNVSSGSNVTLDLHSGNLFSLTMAHATVTITLNNPPASGDGFGFTVKLVQDSNGNRNVSWPASVKWAGGTAPTLTPTANAVDVFTFFTHDNGTNYYGFTAGLNVS